MSEANRVRFFELVERYNQLGTMLPDPVISTATTSKPWPRCVSSSPKCAQHGNRWPQFWMPK